MLRRGGLVRVHGQRALRRGKYMDRRQAVHFKVSAHMHEHVRSFQDVVRWEVT
jgi:hypothetical protein